MPDQDAKPGERIERAPLIRDIDFTHFRMRVTTARYWSKHHHDHERDLLWMRVWQLAGRAEDIPDAGDWMEYRLFDQSWILVRGKDGTIRGFVNACRHRGNAFCEGRGNAARFTCPYHNWTYGLDGQLLAVAKPDFDGTTDEFVGDKAELGLQRVPVEVFGGFIFLNPDPAAAPLAEFLGEMAGFLEEYRCEEMVAFGINVKETIECNWKVVMDAFQEGYHIQGVHPELVAAMDESQERYVFFGDHSIATAPFGVSNSEVVDHDADIAGIRELPATFPAVADSLPRFDQLLAGHRFADGWSFPEGVSPRTLLQQAMRETWTAKGLDVSGLTDRQMTDNQFYLLFPNFFLTIHAGEGTFIGAVPHPDGNPNRCVWHVCNYQWFPPDQRAAMKAALVEVPEGEHFPYFLALEQDYEQMQHQQRGLRNRGLSEMALTRQEVRLAHYHAALDSWTGED